MIDVDVSELNNLAVDLSGAGVLAGIRVLGAMEKSAERIETDARAWAPRKRMPRYARTITHDIAVGAGEIVAEIGPDAEVNGQAKLAPIFEYGTSEVAPRAHVGPALDREIPTFVDAVKEIGGSVL